MKIYVRSDDYSFGLSILFIRASSDSGSANIVRNVGKLTFETVEGPLMGTEFPIPIRREDAQMLIDELWQCGIRPTEGTGSAGAMAATKSHLEDMRRLVFDFPRTINFAEPRS